MERHHRNEDVYDNDPGNIEILCQRCHRSYHLSKRLRETEGGRGPIVALFQSAGCQVYRTPFALAADATFGVPDLFVFSERAGRAWWFETKRPEGGRQSPAQRDFQARCERCGVRYVLGGRAEAWALLQEFGLIPDPPSARAVPV